MPDDPTSTTASEGQHTFPETLIYKIARDSPPAPTWTASLVPHSSTAKHICNLNITGLDKDGEAETTATDETTQHGEAGSTAPDESTQHGEFRDEFSN